MILKEEKQDKFPVAEQGIFQAICVGVYDLGTHYTQQFDKWSRDVLILFELPTERLNFVNDKGENVSAPRLLSKRYTASLHEKSTLRKDLQAWRGRAFTDEELGGFDTHNLLGKNCMVQVMHAKTQSGNVFAKIATILPLMKNFEKMESETKMIHYDMREDNEIPVGIQSWIQKIIETSKEFGEQVDPAPKEDTTTDVPF